MRCTETMKKAVIKMGMTMAKIDAQTSCLWINYQPKEPNAVINLRQKRLRKDN